MKLISWNCCLPPWSFTRGRRLPLIASDILKEKPDIICLQEIFFKRNAQYFITKFTQAGFKYSFWYQDLLTISKEPIISTHSKKFEEQGNLLSFSILDVIYGKAFQVIKIQLQGHKLFIANTHLLSAYALPGKNYQCTRTNQVKEIIRYLATKDSVVLLGDFNFQPSAEPYRVLQRAEYADPSYKTLQTKSNKKLDYIFTKNLSSNQAEVSSKFTNNSDHAFLILELKI